MTIISDPFLNCIKCHRILIIVGFLFLFIHPILTQSDKDQRKLKTLRTFLDHKLERGITCSTYELNHTLPINVDGIGSVLHNVYPSCRQEYYHCRSDWDSNRYPETLDDPSYQRCVKAFWSYVEKGRMDLINIMYESHSYIPEEPSKNGIPNNSGEQNQEIGPSDQNNSKDFDIDDLGTDDIDILEVSPETKGNGSELYCPCKRGDRELFGLCITSSGETYQTGKYPWSEECYVAKRVRKKNE